MGWVCCCHHNHHIVAHLQVRSGALDILQRCVVAAEKFAVPGDVVQVSGVVAHWQVPVMQSCLWLTTETGDLAQCQTSMEPSGSASGLGYAWCIACPQVVRL
jgi:hypothetical protein